MWGFSEEDIEDYYDQGQMDMFHLRVNDKEFQPVLEAMEILTNEKWPKNPDFDKSKTKQWLRKYLMHMDNEGIDFEVRHLTNWLKDNIERKYNPRASDLV